MVNQQVDAFFNRKLKDGFTSPEVEALRQLFHGTIDTEEAAQRYTAECRTAAKPDHAIGCLWDYWSLLEQTARKFPQYHDKLLDMTKAICQLPNVVIGGETVVNWAELPRLDWIWREFVFNRDERAYSEEAVSMAAFTARFSAFVDGWLECAEDEMYTAFEQVPAKQSDLKGPDIQLLNVNVPIATQWIFYAGEAIYNCEEKFNLQKRDGLWTEQPGFSYGRWKFWKERAEWVSNLKLVRNETRQVAKRMVERMTEIENNDGL